MKIMKDQKISGGELYRMIDVNKDHVAQLKEVEDVIETLGDFSKKEIKSIYDYFDTNGNGQVDNIEFIN